MTPTQRQPRQRRHTLLGPVLVADMKQKSLKSAQNCRSKSPQKQHEGWRCPELCYVFYLTFAEAKVRNLDPPCRSRTFHKHVLRASHQYSDRERTRRSRTYRWLEISVGESLLVHEAEPLNKLGDEDFDFEFWQGLVKILLYVSLR